jgi:glycosyltransferase involved in cell wall biosynthesis
VIADSALPVPPAGYGGTERIVSYLVNELAARGHEITLMAAAGSQSPGKLITYSDYRNKNKLFRGFAKFGFYRMLKRALRGQDLVHSVSHLDHLLPALQPTIPKVISFQNPIKKDQLRYIEKWAKGKVVLTACGQMMIEKFKNRGEWQVVHNCVDTTRFSFRAAPEEPPYLTFLGRITPYKGLADAIKVAQKANIPLRIAGKVGNMSQDKHYFRTQVEPLIDGGQIRYLGELDDRTNIDLLGGSIGLLNPIYWDEPFGMVNVEALACGTPVLTYPRGEPQHLIRDGVTGFVCQNVDEMSQKAKNLARLDRSACRQDVECRFSVQTMVDKVEQIYDRLLTESDKAAGGPLLSKHGNEIVPLP